MRETETHMHTLSHTCPAPFTPGSLDSLGWQERGLKQIPHPLAHTLGPHMHTHACIQMHSHTLPKSRSHCLVERVAARGNEENEEWQR